jgi:hypothetical protein
MRKLIFLFLAITLFHNRLHAQGNFGPVQKVPHKDLLKINVAALAFGNISLMDEYTIGNRYSVSLGANYINHHFYKGNLKHNMRSTNLHVTGVGTTLEFRYYTSATKEIPGGFFMGSFVQYTHYIQDSKTNYKDTASDPASAHYDAQSLTLGLTFGYQFIFGDHFSLELFAGPAYTASIMAKKETSPQSYNLDFYPFPQKDETFPTARGGISIGYIF